ncbi:hypothetical protein RB614_15885 [Phytohabitans sp. ZYX-F-186]|uniref:Uncharacterized protein n=1 Tax=Phytohabitans maris TaxID=3071409 RepID=A0ABU0ZG71_9ACTN|nr:hypothetical protein [Phytohabitans sp. ZYX-F-186]MDQ7905993.1 hypothetical protein [Phytohabitans sp. ZYX-F-186]
MPRLLPRISWEPPPEYVEFVEHHLDALRKDAARVVGTERDADCLYPDVLTDVAARWSWLRLRGRLHQADATDLYLRRAFTRRADSWRAPDLLPLESLGETWPVEVQVWSTGSVDPPPPPPPHRVASSVALKLAPHLDPTQRPRAGALAEAAVAWWHACEARRRRRRIAVGVVALVLVALTNRLPQHPSARAAEWVGAGVAVSSARGTVSI